MFTDHSAQVVGHCLARRPVMTRRIMLKSTALAGALAATGMHTRAAPAYQATPAATPGSPPVERTQLYDIVVPPTMMPDNLQRIAAGYWTIDPGINGTIEQENEAIRGCALYLESGSLDVSPAEDAPFWTKDEANGGAPIIIPAGEPVHLKVGDVLYLPAIPLANLDPTGTIRIGNPADVEARLFYFHLHEAGGEFLGWPDGMFGVRPDGDVSAPDKMAEIQQQPAVFRLSEVTSAPNAAVPHVDGVAIVGYFVLDGTLIVEGVGVGGNPWRNRLMAGQAGWIVPVPGVTHEVKVIGDDPARFLELAIFSGETLEEAATPAP